MRVGPRVEAERLNGLAWAKSSVPAIHGLGKDQKNKILINKNRHTGPQFKFVCLNSFMTSMMPLTNPINIKESLSL